MAISCRLQFAYVIFCLGTLCGILLRLGMLIVALDSEYDLLLELSTTQSTLKRKAVDLPSEEPLGTTSTPPSKAKKIKTAPALPESSYDSYTSSTSTRSSHISSGSSGGGHAGLDEPEPELPFNDEEYVDRSDEDEREKDRGTV